MSTHPSGIVPEHRPMFSSHPTLGVRRKEPWLAPKSTWRHIWRRFCLHGGLAEQRSHSAAIRISEYDVVRGWPRLGQLGVLEGGTIRILHVIDSVSDSGGAERGLVREITRFDPSHDQKVVLLYDRTDLVPELQAHRIEHEVVGLSEGSGSRWWPRAVPKVRRIAASFAPDVIQTSLFLGNLVGQLVGRSLGVPVVSNLVLSADPRLMKEFQPGAASLKASLLRRLSGWVANADGVVFRALTSHVRDSSIAQYGWDASRFEVIPRGVAPTSELPTRPRRELGIPEGVTVVLNVARQVPQKNQTALVSALPLLAARIPDVHLVLVGKPGESTSEIERLARELAVGDRVTMVGHRQPVTDYLRHAAVFAFPSKMEGLGTAVLEAMIEGVPVVAADIPPIAEVTGHGRYATLVDPDDPSALATAIEAAANAGPGAGREAAEWAHEKYEISNVARSVEALLSSVAIGSA